MSKKSFKDNTANIDRFFSAAKQTELKPPEIYGTQQTQHIEIYGTQQTQHIQHTHDAQNIHKTNYRINLKLKPEFREYLENESWKAHKSITEYINDLIQADKDTKII